MSDDTMGDVLGAVGALINLALMYAGGKWLWNCCCRKKQAAAATDANAAAEGADDAAAAKTAQREQLQPKKSVASCYALWALAGPFGIHHFYLGRIVHGILATWTLNFLLVGWCLDAVLMPLYVRGFNSRRTHDKAPLDSSTRTLFLKLPMTLFGIIGFAFFMVFWGPAVLQRVGIVDIDRIHAQTLTNPYEILGLSRGADLADAKAAYRKESLTWHPDRNPGCGKECADKMVEITKAFEQIKKRRAPAPPDRTWKGTLINAGKDWMSLFEAAFTDPR